MLKSSLRKYATAGLALLIIINLYGLARIPTLDEQERQRLASRFSFEVTALPTLTDKPRKTIRHVNPSLEHISAWISSVGSSVALNDLDGDGFANDVCLVDPRSDEVGVFPVPGTGDRYRPYTLSVAPLPYDDRTMAPMGCLSGDFNEDGDADLLVYYWGRTPVLFLRRGVTYQPTELVSSGERWFTNAATTADLDGDGHVDLVIGNYFPDGARILDRNADNKEVMQHSMSRAYNGGSTRFLLWADGDFRPRFVEVNDVIPAEVSNGWTLALGAADLDGDLLPELYVANDFGPDRLLHNRSKPGELTFALLEGEKSLTTPSSKVLGRDSFKGMGVDFADLNNDGLLDIYVSNIAAEYALEESHFTFLSTGEIERMHKGVAPYVDSSEPLGLSRSDWSWEARLADFDNDGVAEAMQATGFVKGVVNRWPELQELALSNDELLSNPEIWLRVQPGDDLSGYAPNPFFVRDTKGRYRDIASELGIDQPVVSRGIATGDVDGDGDLDMVVSNQWEPSQYYRNDCPKCGEFLGLNLLLPLAPAQTAHRAGQAGEGWRGRPAIGAEARVHLSDGRVLVAQVDGGNGHAGQRSSNLHFGLGTIRDHERLKVDVRWRDPSGRVKLETLALSPGWHTVRLGWSAQQ